MFLKCLKVAPVSNYVIYKIHHTGAIITEQVLLILHIHFTDNTSVL